MMTQDALTRQDLETVYAHSEEQRGAFLRECVLNEDNPEVIPALHIRLLGDFLLVSGKTPVTSIDWPRLQSLLAYLVLHRDAPQSRSRLAYMLWPDSTDSQAHTNLRNLLHRLRCALPNADHFLTVGRQGLHWQPDAAWTLDIQDFEQAIERAKRAECAQDFKELRQALEEAVKLYRCDLLPGCYEEWILPERDRLRQLFLEALQKLIDLLEQAREYASAISFAQCLLRYDPLREEAYRYLMRLYALSGDRSAALRTYRSCATVLERELAIEPSQATREVYEHITRTDVPLDMPSPRSRIQPIRADVPSPAVPSLVGRQHEWAQLQEVWQHVQAGQPHLVLISGEVGIGKTRLAEELLTWADERGMMTASARCYPACNNVAYVPITSWLRADAFKKTLPQLADIWLAEVSRLVPDVPVKRPGLLNPGPLAECWQRHGLFEALAQAVLGHGQPLLLLLDDLQWCDQETFAWLSYLLHFDAKSKILLVGTVRMEEIDAGHPLRSLLMTLHRDRDRQLTEMTLEPLNIAETALLAEQITGQTLNTSLVTALYQETEGNPLFIVETLRTGMAELKEKALSSVEKRPAYHGSLPSTVQAVIEARLEQLSLQARAVANLASVIGRTFTFSVLAQASDDEDALVSGLDELWRRGIVREQRNGVYNFSHNKLREVAYTALCGARRRVLHRRAAEALAAVYADALDEVGGQIAQHYERACCS